MAFLIKQGDTRPTYVVELRERIGTPDEQQIPGIDNALSLYFLMRAKEAGPADPPLLRALAQYWVDPDDPGVYTAAVEYIWESGDTDKPPGLYDVEVEIEWEAGAIETVPNKGYFELEITPDLG